MIEKGIVREQAYDSVQPLAMQAWENQIPFKPLVEADDFITGHLSQAEIDDAFDLNHHTRNVDVIFKRVGLS